MPDFVMPEPAPVIEAPVEPQPERDPRSPPGPSAGREAAEPIGRRPWGQLVVAALIGVVVGAGIPGAVQGLDRAAADARVDRLRQTAMDYLTAVAEGASDRATAMVPVDGATPPDAVLQSAERIEGPEVRLTTVDGDAASVEVRYRVAGRTVSRALEAEEVDGTWRLRTSIAETALAYANEGAAGVSVAGVELPRSGTLLYPGAYESDRVEGSLVVSGGDPFVVDGDPSTPAELFSTVELTPALADLATEVALAHVRACDAACTFAPDAQLRSDGPWVLGVDPSTGAVDVSVQVWSGAFSGQAVDMQLRALVQEGGTLVSWLCSVPAASPFELAPCRG